MKPIRMENGVIVYYGNFVGHVANGRAVVDPMFEGSELNAFLEKQGEIREVSWKDGVFDRLTNGVRDTREILLINCRVWQLKPDVDARMKFVGYDEMLQSFSPPDPEHYEAVFDGPVDTADLEALYTKFNIDQPPDYHGHSLSMSDVIELYDDLDSTFHYVDHFGFRQVDFTSPEQQITPDMQL